MPNCDLLLRNATVMDGTGLPAQVADVAVSGGTIESVAAESGWTARTEMDCTGLALAPGFIDVHTHDDIAVLLRPEMLPKISQGVTSVVVGNCGISAAPVRLRGPEPPDPMNLLGSACDFRFRSFREYVAEVNRIAPAVNVAALTGHTSLRSNHMDRLDRAATPTELSAMRAQLEEALDAGALGLSTGLAYQNAIAATTDEIIALTQPLAKAGGVYTTHLRSETEAILAALDEAFSIGREAAVPVVVSHLKCAGIANWGRSGEILASMEAAQKQAEVGWDCYPYAAGSSTLDLRQVDPRVAITITWSTPHPEVAGRALADIAANWELDQIDAAARLQPAGAIYHSISEADMRRILAHPGTMIGSDGLPMDPNPHPRLWGTFPRVLGKYGREENLFSMEEAVHRMTGLPARRFRLHKRGLLRQGYAADLVLFDPATVLDCATYQQSQLPAHGIHAVWVNGRLTCADGRSTGDRAGTFLHRTPAEYAAA